MLLVFLQQEKNKKTKKSKGGKNSKDQKNKPETEAQKKKREAKEASEKKREDEKVKREKLKQHVGKAKKVDIVIYFSIESNRTIRVEISWDCQNVSNFTCQALNLLNSKVSKLCTVEANAANLPIPWIECTHL